MKNGRVVRTSRVIRRDMKGRKILDGDDEDDGTIGGFEQQKHFDI